MLAWHTVAFHTSVYGIFFSLVFSFIYKAAMADAYTAMERFQNAFRQFVMPVRSTEEDDASAMIIYQAMYYGDLKNEAPDGDEKTGVIHKILQEGNYEEVFRNEVYAVCLPGSAE